MAEWRAWNLRWCRNDRPAAPVRSPGTGVNFELWSLIFEIVFWSLILPCTSYTAHELPRRRSSFPAHTGTRTCEFDYRNHRSARRRAIANCLDLRPTVSSVYRELTHVWSASQKYLPLSMERRRERSSIPTRTTMVLKRRLPYSPWHHLVHCRTHFMLLDVQLKIAKELLGHVVLENLHRSADVITELGLRFDLI